MKFLFLNFYLNGRVFSEYNVSTCAYIFLLLHKSVLPSAALIKKWYTPNDIISLLPLLLRRLIPLLPQQPQPSVEGNDHAYYTLGLQLWLSGEIKG